MSQHHIVVTRRIPEPGLEILRQTGARVTVLQTDEESGVDRGALLAAVADADAVLALLSEKVDREFFAAGGSRLRGVANMAVGYNNIDVPVATELGVPVTNTPGVLTDTTADFTWAMILAVARRIPEAHNYMVDGRYKIWGPNLLVGGDLSPGGSGQRKVLGIVGYGRIGEGVAQRAVGFEMDILAHDPYNKEGIDKDDRVQWAELDELIAKSDFVTLHPPLNAETHHMISEAELRAMKSTAYLINAARGPVVDEKALVVALRERWIAGAALDVYEDEPAMAPGLAELDNAVLLPHIASASIDTRAKMATMAAVNTVAFLRGEPAPNVLNPEVYDTDAYRARG
ncbi:MAG: D-glycerate dehydrogenase [Acidobacteriota bacterium]